MKRLVAILLVLCLVFVIIPQFAFASSPDTESGKDYVGRPFPIVSLLIIYVLMVIPIILIKWLISIPFQMYRECAKVILLTNLITQIGMHLLELVLIACVWSPVAYSLIWLWLPVIITALSIIECVIEFFIYRNKMLGFTDGKILLYVICANLSSIVLQMLIIF